MYLEGLQFVDERVSLEPGQCSLAKERIKKLLSDNQGLISLWYCYVEL